MFDDQVRQANLVEPQTTVVGVFGKRADFYAPPSPAIGRFESAIVLRVHSGFEWASPALTSASASAVAFCRQAAWRQGAIVVGRVLRLNLLFEPSTYQLWMLRQVLDFKFVREFGIPASYAHSMNCRRCLWYNRLDYSQFDC